jgi:hypothetical protein
MDKPANYVIVKCESEDEAQKLLDHVVDEFESATVWPYLAFDDGFGHFVRKGEAE